MSATFSQQQVKEATRGRWLRDLVETLRGVFTDTRQPVAEALFVPLRGPNFDAHEFLGEAVAKGAGAVMVEESYFTAHQELEDLPVPILLVRDTLYALGELARYYRANLSPRTIAITGSVGKTTVKELIASVARQRYEVHSTRANYNNLIGVPLEILRMSIATEVLVVECGADRPGEISRLTEITQPNIGVVTHIVPCHLERFGTIQRVAEEKGQLLTGLQEPAATAVVNIKAPERSSLLSGCKAPVRFYGKGSESVIWAEKEHLHEDGTASFDICDARRRIPVHLNIVGTHQIDNALAAAAVGTLLDLGEDEIRAGLEGYQGTWGRMQRMELPDGVLLLEDVYNSNPASMQAALDFLANFRNRKRIGVFGEMWDLGRESEHWHRVVGRQISRDHVDTLIAVGSLAGGFAEGAASNEMPPHEIYHFETSEKALEWLLNNRKPGSLILVKGSRGMKMETISEGLKNG